MTTQKHHDLPGSAAWLARRARCFNAGDAAAMLGCSPHKTRTQLMHELHTGIAQEFSDYVQKRVIDKGHRVEEFMCPFAEDVLGEDLTVVGFSRVVDGLSRPLGASLDGTTFVGDTNWECKSLNADIRAALPHDGSDSAEFNDSSALHKMYRVQMEQQQAVSGAKRTLFSGGEIDAEGTVTEERHAWYTSDPALRAEIIAGWKQFDADLAAYVPPTAPVVEKLVAEPVESLPAPAVQVSGQIALVDNFKPFEQRLREFLDTKLIREPKTDEDFVNLDAQIKSMKSWREDLKGAKGQMLAQVEPIDRATKTADMLDKLLQQNCAMAERLLKDEKERRRTEIVTAGQAALQQHVAGQNARLGKPYMPQALAQADFGGAIKGMRSLSSMEDAVDTLLAKSKIAANETFERVMANLTTLREKAAAHAFLFADTAQLVLKAEDDLAAIVSSRISEHEAKEAARLQAERDRIAAEEKAKAEAAAAADARRLADEAAAKARAEERARHEQQMAEAEAARQVEEASQRQAIEARIAAAPAAPAAAAPAVLQMPVRAAAPAPAEPAPLTKPTLRLGVINERLAACGLATTAEGLKLLGFAHVEKDRSALMYHERDWPYMLAAMVQRLEAITATAAA